MEKKNEIGNAVNRDHLVSQDQSCMHQCYKRQVICEEEGRLLFCTVCNLIHSMAFENIWNKRHHKWRIYILQDKKVQLLQQVKCTGSLYNVNVKGMIHTPITSTTNKYWFIFLSPSLSPSLIICIISFFEALLQYHISTLDLNKTTSLPLTFRTYTAVT